MVSVYPNILPMLSILYLNLNILRGNTKTTIRDREDWPWWARCDTSIGWWAVVKNFPNEWSYDPIISAASITMMPRYAWEIPIVTSTRATIY